MRLGFNACTSRGHGSKMVAQGIFRGLESLDKGRVCKAWLPDCWSTEVADNDAIRFNASGAMNKLILENIVIRESCLKGEIDKLFSVTDTSMMSCPIPNMLLVQQAYLAYPEEIWKGYVDRKFMRRIRLMRAYFKAGVKSVSLFTVQSKCMKARLSSTWNIDKEKIVVIPSATLHTSKEIKEREIGDEEYICYIASAGMHKNHTIFPKILASLRRRGIQIRLRLTIKPEDVPLMVAEAEMLGVDYMIDYLGPVSNSEAFELMKKAIALVMPSRLESFGLPFYEAMAIGCPVIASDLDFAREALGEAGMYADSEQPEEFADNISMIIDSNERRDEMSISGQNRSRLIGRSWEQIAKEYVRYMEHI